MITKKINCKLINLKYFDDKNSTLIAIEKQVNCPFEIKRIFYIFDVPKNTIRGEHANLNSEFFFIVLKGECKIKIDNGKEQKKFILNNPKQGLYIDKMLWKQMYDFSKDCILLVLSNTLYDANEYIRDYNEFLKAVDDT
ncbi:WxcM-like domain-containing protein [Campylobacter coli]|uniref:sugar 3,4-ketoisomerase n=1 Tax=Campylobacter coli TaxID=195 RepID=UPI0002581DA4|nr:FdtA/QdtA family cupin domain-containing protein [Campylobacter coli]EAC1339064.1 WxcM-like domain-containing protein [Campylobacter coli]EAC1804228.1 WxcM-like domain-containing protein [Campylobacter coli]EAC2139647.1 WxcM-like domain-containing protein [Campylobacter coli]EAH4948957.1 WxcM-like domain-containing protein [Campylobacter coli]EAH4980710.1 WxcM-like domain-containing protein [Campylobacter coli]